MQATKTTLARPQAKAQEIVDKYPNAQSILVVGVAFKPGESYTMNAPGLELAKALQSQHGKTVYIHDPLVTPIDGYTHLDEASVNDEIKNHTFDAVCIAMKQVGANIEHISSLCSEYNVSCISFCHHS
jgi:UDP-N-acetyl-D-mannosaminuronate dehydrogenase